MFKHLNSKNIYLDYAGATPMSREVAKKMSFYKEGFFANPSAIYSSGVKVREVIEESRKKIAESINAHSDEIIFTGSGTESVALAILGVVNNFKENFKNIVPHIITSNIEHPAVLKNFQLLEKRGEVEVSYLNVDESGLVNPKDLRDLLKPNTILVSVMYANNEIGTIEPIMEIAKEIRHFKKIRQEKMREKALPLESPRQGLEEHFSLIFPALHTDACQAMNYLFTENIEKLGVDLLSFNSSKIYGPKGVGVLYKKRSVNLSPVYDGGGQEFGLRSGTESASLIVGVASALELANKLKHKEVERLKKLQDYFINKIPEIAKETDYTIILNGDRENRLPNNINISISEISSELLVIELSAYGIFVSEKSACKSEDTDASYVINALREQEKKESSNHSIRISMGRETTKKDLDILIKSLEKILNKYKNWLN